MEGGRCHCHVLPEAMSIDFDAKNLSSFYITLFRLHPSETTCHAESFAYRGKIHPRIILYIAGYKGSIPAHHLKVRMLPDNLHDAQAAPERRYSRFS